jgi:adenylate cyclase
MDDAQFAELAAWIPDAGLAGQSESTILAGFCERQVLRGVPLGRAIVLIDTLHPIYEGRAFRGTRAQKETTLTEYGRSDDDLNRWQRSPFSRLEESGDPFLRRRLTAETEAEFSVFPELRSNSMTDYVAIANRFAGDEIIGDIYCVYSSWTTDAREVFAEDDVADLCRLAPFLALAVKSASLARIAATLVETYLGRGPGRRVLQGRIARGVAERIEAVLWFSDLHSYTRISDTASPEQIIPLLNHYADAIISAIHEHGGDVLKLIGDGGLAIFTAESRGHACDAALTAALAARRSVAAVNQRRAAKDLPTTDMYLGLHVGEVFYGNIGTKDRLDFTVIGPAVNEVSRIAAMCRSVDQPLLVSSAFASSIGKARNRLVSVGRYALRGVGRPQDLFTLELE